jgi:hypothetical protein
VQKFISACLIDRSQLTYRSKFYYPAKGWPLDILEDGIPERPEDGRFFVKQISANKIPSFSKD